MPYSIALMQRLDVLDPEMKGILYAILDEIEQHRETSVTKNEFNELKEIVRRLGESHERMGMRIEELTEAQKRTEQRIEELTGAQKRTEQRIEELTEAQKRTEQILAESLERADKRMESLTQAQARTEQILAESQERADKRMERIDKRMESLAQAQERTEQVLAESQERIDKRIESLTQAQARTEQILAESQERADKRMERIDKRIESLTQAQERTEQRIESLSKAMEGLAKAQEELAHAQKQTEKEVAKLSGSLNGTRGQVGGLSRSVAYALENEAFWKLPELIRTRFNLEIREKFVRTFIRGEEINLFAKAGRNGEEVLLVGEAVLRLDDHSKMAQLEKNVTVVKAEHGLPVIPLIITHFAHPEILQKACEKGVLVVQSFEWD